MLKRLDEAGAAVDFNAQMAKIPSSLIKESVNLAPKSFTMAGRDPKNDFELGDGKTRFAMSCGPTVLDMETGEHRPVRVKDAKDWARLGDALENISICAPAMAADFPTILSDRYEFMTQANNTKKHFLAMANTLEGAEDLVEMASIIIGGKEELEKRPIFHSAGTATLSPLRTGSLDFLEVFCRHKIPVNLVSETLLGANVPVTLAGALVVTNAEVLTCVLLSQLIRKGAPVIFIIGGTHILDMRTLKPLTAGPERALIALAEAQICRHHGLPGGQLILSDSNSMDLQAGYETMLAILAALMSGTSRALGVGSSPSGKGVSFEKAVIDNEIIDVARRFVRGIEVNDETLALDVVRKAGIGGKFIDSAHTLKHFRREIQQLELTDRLSKTRWLELGAKDMVAKAKEKAKEIIRTHQVEPLPKDVQKKLMDVIKSANKKTESYYR